jgi:hypothetical protein
MKTKTLIILIPALLLAACGPSKQDIAKTCECEALNAKIKGLEGEYMLSEQMSSTDAEKRAINDNKEAYDKCTQLHKNMGDDNYTKASQLCK